MINRVWPHWSPESDHIDPKYRKKYDAPQTPFHRVLASDHVSNEIKEDLKAIHQSLNPFILKRTIEKKLRVAFKHVKVTSNVRQRIWFFNLLRYPIIMSQHEWTFW